jgi:hypothetical protein
MPNWTFFAIIIQQKSISYNIGYLLGRYWWFFLILTISAIIVRVYVKRKRSKLR